MKISVNKDGNIGSIQEQFNNYYPYLKIEFYGSNDVVIGEKQTATKPFLNPRLRFRDSGKTLKNGEVIVSDEMTVAELEKKLYETFGLYAEVLRKSGNIWLETTLTDNWTLLQQNNMGEMIS